MPFPLKDGSAAVAVLAPAGSGGQVRSREQSRGKLTSVCATPQEASPESLQAPISRFGSLTTSDEDGLMFVSGKSAIWDNQSVRKGQ